MSERLISAGLDTLWISMDGFDREEYEKIRLGGRFQKIAENIKEFNRIYIQT
jgi:molybdenum cofactor biosynthesis enzyme MoaA